MRRLLLLFAVLLVASLACVAGGAQAEQGSWQPRLSLYSGQFDSVAFMSRDVVLATGPGGILRSEDGGRSWSWAITQTIADMALAGDGQHALAVGPGGVILATADGGRTWASQQSGTVLDLFDVLAFDSQSAIVLGQHFVYSCIPTNDLSPYVVLRTDDGGQSWQRIAFPGNYQPSRLTVVSGGNRVWLSANYCAPNAVQGSLGNCVWEPAAFRSDDRGRTWTRIEQAPLPASAVFVSANVGWALDGKKLTRTDDQGKSWHTVREWTDLGAYAGELNVLTEDTIILVENDGNGNSQTIKTVNAGRTWSNIGQPGTNHGALTYFDEQHAVRVDWSPISLNWSDDGGVTWQAGDIPVFAASYGAVFDFADAMNGWVGGTRLLRTTDGGLSWQPVSDLQPFALDFVSPTEGWAIESDCTGYPCKYALLHSVDGGVTWQERLRFETDAPSAITFVDPLDGWLVLSGSPEHSLMHTRDGGKTWQEQAPPGDSFDFVDANLIWTTGEAADEKPVFVSHDGGDTWSQAGSVRSQSGLQLAASDGMHAWAVSEDYAPGDRGERLPPFTLYRTVDGGVHWEQLGERSEDRFWMLRFFSTSEGIGVRLTCPDDSGVDCHYYLTRTFDGGLTWDLEPTGAVGQQAFRSVFNDPWHGWSIQTTGVYAYSIAGITLYKYSATAPVRMPGVGEGHESENRTPAPIILAAFGVLLVSVATVSRRRGRPC